MQLNNILKLKYDEFVRQGDVNMVNKTERKNEDRKIFIVESVSTFRIRHAVFATCEEDAADEFIMRDNDDTLTEMSQEHIGANIFSIREVKEKEFIKEFDKDNDYFKNWSKEQKLSTINVIDYEE